MPFRTFIGTVALTLALSPALSSAQSAAQGPAARPQSLLESFARAQTLIDAAVAAHGGADALQAARRVRVTADGWDFHPTQGRRLGAPFDSTVWRSDAMIDLSRGRIVRQRVRGWPGGFSYTDWYVSDSARHFYIEPRNQRYSPAQYPPADQQYGNFFLFPPWYVLAAHESPRNTRRYLGRFRLRGNVEVDAVQFTIPPTNAPIVIGLDPQSHQLRASLGMTADVFAGDTDLYAEFLDWRPIEGGLLVPGRSLQYRGATVTNTARFTSVTPNYAIPDSLLAPPVGFTQVQPTPPTPSVRELAPGVWTVGSGSKGLVVAMSDHVIVVDAPSSTSAEIIATIATLAPGKPIRYVIPTHHHDDHFMGVRYHARAGTTIVTTPGNVDYLRRILSAPMSTLMLPRNQVAANTNYRVETISGGARTFSDATRSLEIHQIASPHAEETLIAWLPVEGILFQADLIEAPATGVALRGANAETTTHLATVIRAKGWHVRVFAGAHSTLESPQTFEELVRLPVIPPARIAEPPPR